MFSKLEYAYNRYLAGWEYACKVMQDNVSHQEYQKYLEDIKILSLEDFEFRLTHHEEFSEVFGKECTEPLTLEERIDIWFHRDKPNRDVVDYFDDQLNIEKKLEFLKDREVPFRKIVK
jgi:hypothetical protein